MITVGIDEVGRGCWAGPVVAGAVILKRRIPGLADSKKLTKTKREELDLKIRKQAVAFGLGWVPAAEVDEVGLTEAVRLAMQRAMAEIQVHYDQIVIDGNYNYLSAYPGSTCLVKADDTVAAVSAASIIAKVARDNYMAELSANYPGYDFHKHVGYGTKAHIAALQALGICDLHRQSYAPIKALLTAAA